MPCLGTAGLVLALRVVTSTPDALCPPLRAAEEAISARVGEVSGQDVVAHYRVVRSADGGELLVLELNSEGTGDLLLHRELPLKQLACADAATAIALQIESYFASVAPERPPEEQVTAAPSRSEAAATNHAGEERVTIEVRRVPVPATPSPSPGTTERGQGPSLGVALSLGLATDSGPTVGLGLRYRPMDVWDFVLSGATSLHEVSVIEPFAALSQYSGWLSFRSGYRWSRGPWSASLGPSLVVLLESARVTGGGTSGLVVSPERGAFRAVVGVGGEAEAEIRLSRTVGFLAGVRGGPMFGAGSRAFQLEDPVQGETVEVLAAPSAFFMTWVGLAFRTK